VEIESEENVLSPYDNFVYALRVKETKRQYPHRLDIFMSFMELQGTIEEKCAKLYDFSKDNVNLLQSYIIKFINSKSKELKTKRLLREPFTITSRQSNFSCR
jgi:hypothetical protein